MWKYSKWDIVAQILIPIIVVIIVIVNIGVTIRTA
jgi:ABC-type phosphate/phosphonate transport system permease subunit